MFDCYINLYIGFQPEAANFFIFFLTLFLLTVGASSTVFFVSAGVGVTAVATLLIPLAFVTQMVSIIIIYNV